jgi:hypothetical protein
MNEEINPSSSVRGVARLLAYLQFLFCGPFTIASAIASLCLCCPCIAVWIYSDEQNRSIGICKRMRRLFANCMSSWGLVWVFLLGIVPAALLLGITGLALVIAIGAVVYPFYAFGRLAGLRCC